MYLEIVLFFRRGEMSKRIYLITVAVFMVAIMFLGCVKDIKNTENEPVKSSSNVVEKTQESSSPINETTDDNHIAMINSTEESDLTASVETESTEVAGSITSIKTESIEVAGLTDSTEIVQPDQATESQKAITVKDVDSDFPKDTEDIQKYLKKVSINDTSGMQYQMDFASFLKDYGAIEIVNSGDPRSDKVQCYVSFRNGIIVRFSFEDRIPYSSPLGWNSGEIFANSNGPYSFKGDGFQLSKWSKKFSLDPIVCDEKDYFLIEPADDFWRIGELDDEKYIDQSKRTPIKLPKNFQSLFEENIQPYLELKDFSYEYDPVG